MKSSPNTALNFLLFSATIASRHASYALPVSVVDSPGVLQLESGDGCIKNISILLFKNAPPYHLIQI